MYQMSIHVLLLPVGKYTMFDQIFSGRTPDISDRPGDGRRVHDSITDNLPGTPLVLRIRRQIAGSEIVHHYLRRTLFDFQGAHRRQSSFENA
jgi:hypothetical protein